MRRFIAVLLVVGALVMAGCGPRQSTTKGPTVDAFNGRLTHDSKPVQFDETEKVLLQVFHEKGRSFGIPIQTDGSFKIGWMPIGSYGAVLKRDNPDGKLKSGQRMYTLPQGFKIVEGQTEYTIELGKDWQP
jgi:hypothetical protein